MPMLHPGWSLHPLWVRRELAVVWQAEHAEVLQKARLLEGRWLPEGGQRFRRGGGGSSAKRTQASGSAGRSRVSCEHALQHEGQRHLQVLWVSVRPAPLRLCPAALLRAQLTSHVLLCRLDARLVNPESLSYCQLRNELLEDDYEPEYLLHARWHEDGDDSRGYVTTAWATTGMHAGRDRRIGDARCQG